MGPLEGKKCLITGASRGLGAEIARKCWRDGANLFLVARTKDALHELIRSLPSGRSQAEMFAADLSLPEAPRRIAAAFKERFGALDALINNAALHGAVGPFHLTAQALWESSFAVNFFAPARLARECVPLMGKSGRGKMIFLSGGGAAGARANFTAYSTAKTAIVRLAENLAQELAPLSIDVNCIAPGPMPTALLREILDTGPEKAGQQEYNAAARIMRSGGQVMENAAELAAYLASAGSDGITGKLISAVWDPWRDFEKHKAKLAASDIYTLRRIVPEDRGEKWN